MLGLLTSGPFLGFLFNISQLFMLTSVIVWSVSVRRRIIQLNMRRLLISQGLILLFLLFIQIVKYSYIWEPPVAVRLLNYSYQIPVAALPLPAFYSALCLGRPDGWEPVKRWLWLTVPCAAIVLLFMSNEAHQLVYIIAPDGELSGYSFVYYLSYVWQIVLFLSAFILVMLRSRLFRKTWRAMLPLFFLSSGLALFVVYYIYGPHLFPGLSVQFQYIYIFMTIGFWESCIQLGFIPSNTEYERIMKLSSVKAMVTDLNGNRKYGSDEFTGLSWQTLKNTVDSSAQIAEDIRLSGRRLDGGFGFWEDDLSVINGLQDELRDTAQLLGEETLLLQKEAQIKEEKARLEIRSAVYDQLSRELEPQMRRIEELVFDEEGNSLHAKCTDAEWRERISRAAAVGAYVKRKANLYILSRDADTLELQDLLLSVRESLEYMKLMGVSGTVFADGGGTLPSMQILEAYELCYAYAEALYGLRSVMVSMSAKPVLSLKLELSGSFTEKEAEAISGSFLASGHSCRLSSEFEDDVLYVSAVWPGGEA